jgi:hypothetical protein
LRAEIELAIERMKRDALMSAAFREIQLQLGHPGRPFNPDMPLRNFPRRQVLNRLLTLGANRIDAERAMGDAWRLWIDLDVARRGE